MTSGPRRASLNANVEPVQRRERNLGTGAASRSHRRSCTGASWSARGLHGGEDAPRQALFYV